MCVASLVTLWFLVQMAMGRKFIQQVREHERINSVRGKRRQSVQVLMAELGCRGDNSQ